MNQVQPLNLNVRASPLSSGAVLNKSQAAPKVTGSDDRRGKSTMQFSQKPSSRERSERVILQDDSGLRMQSELYHNTSQQFVGRQNTAGANPEGTRRKAKKYFAASASGPNSDSVADVPINDSAGGTSY